MKVWGGLRSRMTQALFQWDAASAAAISSGLRSRPARGRTSRTGHRSHIAALKPRAMSRADPAAARGVFQSWRPISQASPRVANMLTAFEIAMSANGSPPRRVVSNAMK